MSARPNRRTHRRPTRPMKIPCTPQRIVEDGPWEVQVVIVSASAIRLYARQLFRPGMHRSALVGIFLAVLELVRHDRVRTEQNDLFGEIWILPGADTTVPLDPSDVDNYEHTIDGQ